MMLKYVNRWRRRIRSHDIERKYGMPLHDIERWYWKNDVKEKCWMTMLSAIERYYGLVGLKHDREDTIKRWYWVLSNDIGKIILKDIIEGWY